jgi:hypothetical protein
MTAKLILLKMTSIVILLFASAPRSMAESDGAIGVFRGQNYTVTVGSNGSFRGCHHRGRCVFIAQPYSCRDGFDYNYNWFWVHKGLTYRMIPEIVPQGMSARSAWNFDLKVTNSRGRVILHKELQSATEIFYEKDDLNRQVCPE